MTVTAFTVLRRAPFDGGRAFGRGGAYERIDAVATIAVDPNDSLNAGIADLDLAPRTTGGRVTFAADVVVLRPAGGTGNGGLLSSVVNRGRTALLPFSYPPAGFVPGTGDRIEPGDGFLLDGGWTVALCGWQWDVVRRPGALGIEAPRAFEVDGRPASTNVTVRFQPLTARASEYLGHWPAHPTYTEDRVHQAYPAADLGDPTAVLTVQDHPADSPRVVPRSSWRFARALDSGAEEANARWLTLDHGFEAGRIYQVTYRTDHCPVAGAGLLAIRDITSFLRFDDSGENPCRGTVRHAFAHGVSQTGRFLREFLRVGCNADEASRRVFDGILVQIAGARRGEFNFRGAQPSAQYVPGPAFEPPYTYVPTSTTSATLLDACRERGVEPLVFELNTSNEYWRSNAILVHADPGAGRDLELPANVRAYMMAGCQHGPGIPFVTDRAPLTPEQRVANPLNMLNYTPFTRAALVALADWACAGVPPPESAVPRLDDATAADPRAVLDALRHRAPLVRPDLERSDLAAPGALPTLVPAIDEDGNDSPGLRLPELAVPLVTHTAWNVRHPETGGDGQPADMVGSSLPFPETDGGRADGDSRRALSDRYASADAYAKAVRAAALALVERR